MQLFNLSATLNVSRLLYNPSLCLPHITIKTFDQLKLPIEIPGLNVQIKGIVLDKDNCISKDQDDKIFPQYEAKWKELTSLYSKDQLLIVSNSAGTNDDINHAQAKQLVENIGQDQVSILIHSIKKPGCNGEILAYFDKHNIKPNEILVIGDRLFTDVLMANMMGSYSCWVSQGVELSNKMFPKLERQVYSQLVEYKYQPPTP